MRSRLLGKTGITVSELALGTWGLSGDGYGSIAETALDRTVDRALERGVTLFDTADSYGGGATEAKLAARLPPEAILVTKIGTDRAVDPPKKRFDPTYLRIAFERCQERQKKEQLDVVLLHNPQNATMDACQATAFMVELKKRGLMKAWGVSAGSASVAREAIHQGAEVIELAYNVFSCDDLHEVANEVAMNDVGVLARSVLSHGLLTGHWSAERDFPDGDHRQHRWTPNELRTRISDLDAMRPLVTGNVTSLRSVALRFVLANELVTAAVLGPRSVAQLDQLVREAGDGPPYLRDTALAELATRLRTLGVST
jgi:aryl-alcohol dehydrogenase-like predicted oxidoreductase